MAAVLAVVDGVEAQVELELDDVVDGLVLEGAELLVVGDDDGLLAVEGDPLVDELLGPQQRAQVLRSEGRSLVVLSGSHGVVNLGR